MSNVVVEVKCSNTRTNGCVVIVIIRPRANFKSTNYFFINVNSPLMVLLSYLFRFYFLFFLTNCSFVYVLHFRF